MHSPICSSSDAAAAVTRRTSTGARETARRLIREHACAMHSAQWIVTKIQCSARLSRWQMDRIAIYQLYTIMYYIYGLDSHRLRALKSLARCCITGCMHHNECAPSQCSPLYIFIRVHNNCEHMYNIRYEYNRTTVYRHIRFCCKLFAQDFARFCSRSLIHALNR